MNFHMELPVLVFHGHFFEDYDKWEKDFCHTIKYTNLQTPQERYRFLEMRLGDIALTIFKSLPIEQGSDLKIALNELRKEFSVYWRPNHRALNF